MILAIIGDAILPSVSAKHHNKGNHSEKYNQMNFIADVVEDIAPSVVYIEIASSYNKSSNGSGFVINANGLLLTNAHVVANKNTVLVHLHDGTVEEGVVQAVDPVSDLATIKIKRDNLKPLKLGDSSQLRAGEWVIALGSPLSLSNTVTVGIVSRTGRKSSDLGIYNKDIDYIQTDALITFGHSGGPLVNLDGEVIGINTMKVTTGISFAIPIDYAKLFITKAEALDPSGSTESRRITSSEFTHKRFIGITMLSLNEEIIQELRMRNPNIPDSLTSGIFIHKVCIPSPAYRSGLRPGDIIVEINAKKAASSADIYKAVELKVYLDLVVLRDGQKVKVKVVPDNLQ